MSDFEDEEHTSFFELERGDGGKVVLSEAAATLHAAGLAESVRDDTPGFISDDYLSNIAAETNLTAMELVTAGEWERVEGGYRVADPQMQSFAESLHATLTTHTDWGHDPADCAEHIDGPNSRGRCIRCGTPVDDEGPPTPES